MLSLPKRKKAIGTPTRDHLTKYNLVDNYVPHPLPFCSHYRCWGRRKRDHFAKIRTSNSYTHMHQPFRSHPQFAPPHTQHLAPTPTALSLLPAPAEPCSSVGSTGGKHPASDLPPTPTRLKQYSTVPSGADGPWPPKQLSKTKPTLPNLRAWGQHHSPHRNDGAHPMNFLNISHLPHPHFYLFLSVPIVPAFLSFQRK